MAEENSSLARKNEKLQQLLKNYEIVKNTINSDNLTDYYDWKLNQLTDEDLTRPNLIGYTITSE